MMSWSRLAPVLLYLTAYSALPAERPTKLITVCELLQNPRKYQDQNIALLGRLDCEHSLIDNPCNLVEEQCQRPLTTQGESWPNAVAIVDWETGLPRPSLDPPRLDPKRLEQKLAQVRRSTQLRTHREPRYRKEGKTLSFTEFVPVPDEWRIAYGRIHAVKKLIHEPSHDEPGCGGLAGAPVAIIIGPQGLLDLQHPRP